METTNKVMSLHHKWAEKIFSGEKTIEIRKNKPRKGRCFLVYDTKKKFICGQVDFGAFIEIKEITENICRRSCLSKEEILKYKGNRKIYAWIVEIAVFYAWDWHTLEEIGVKRAPQSWQYIKEKK